MTKEHTCLKEQFLRCWILFQCRQGPVLQDLYLGFVLNLLLKLRETCLQEYDVILKNSMKSWNFGFINSRHFSLLFFIKANTYNKNNKDYKNVFPLHCVRSSSGFEVHHESHGTSAADWPTAVLCHPYVCHNWAWLLHGQVSPHLLQDRHR